MDTPESREKRLQAAAFGDVADAYERGRPDREQLLAQVRDLLTARRPTNMPYVTECCRAELA